METITGRKEEKKLLQEVLQAAEAQLLAVYGRRRVGKTFLIKNFFQQQVFFEYTGIHKGTLKQQLEAFIEALTTFSNNKLPIAVPPTWMQAFKLLQQAILPELETKKVIVFLDEFPWLHTPKSGFEQAFGHFWNSWASGKKNIIVVICGSAASWMIQRVVNNKGGLHNRVTKTMRLLPFTLSETRDFLQSRNIKLTHYHLLQLYMAMGGIPQYLKQVKAGQTAMQNIDNICFTSGGMLNDEFDKLYQSLFEHAEKHISVIRALARKASGLTRNEIISACNLQSGGGTTALLDELEQSGFITAYTPFDKTIRDRIYKISDEYSLFYIKFIAANRKGGAGTWGALASSPSWRSWSGIAFESICHKHIKAIKVALGIPAVYTSVSAWRHHPVKGEHGAQIDLLIDRKDDSINVCEMKFAEAPFTISKSYAGDLHRKLQVFKERTATRKQLFLTMITTYGVKENNYRHELVSNDLTMDILFDA